MGRVYQQTVIDTYAKVGFANSMSTTTRGNRHIASGLGHPLLVQLELSLSRRQSIRCTLSNAFMAV